MVSDACHHGIQGEGRSDCATTCARVRRLALQGHGVFKVAILYACLPTPLIGRWLGVGCMLVRRGYIRPNYGIILRTPGVIFAQFSQRHFSILVDMNA